MRDEDVRVLEIGDEHQMIVHHHVGEQVVLAHGGEPVLGAGPHHAGQSEKEAYVRPDDIQAVLGGEQRRIRIEVAVVLALVLSRARGIHQQVAGHPSHGQHDDDLGEVGQGGVEEDLVHQVFLDRRREYLVVLAAPRVVVVLAVGDAPGMVRDEEGGVQDPPHQVVHPFVRGERLMPAFMGNHPHACQHRALRVPVERPQ